MRIGSNKRMLTRHAILLIKLWLIVFFVVFLFISTKVQFAADAHYVNHFLIIAFLVLLVFVLAVVTIGFFKMPKGVSLDNVAGTVTLSFLFQNELVITIDQIEAYSSGHLYMRTAANKYRLIQLILSNGKIHVLTEFDLASIVTVQQFLDVNGIVNLGEAEFSYFKYVLGLTSLG